MVDAARFVWVAAWGVDAGVGCWVALDEVGVFGGLRRNLAIFLMVPLMRRIALRNFRHARDGGTRLAMKQEQFFEWEMMSPYNGG